MELLFPVGSDNCPPSGHHTDMDVDVVAAAAQNTYYSTIWRTSLGIGVVFPLVLFVIRLKLKEPEEFSRNSMKHTKTPYLLVFRYYGFRLLIVSIIWFLYDVSLLHPSYSSTRIILTTPSSPYTHSACTQAPSSPVSMATRLH